MSDGAKKFWMVVGDGPAKFRHATKVEAEIEAKRLARFNPDQWFYVVETVSAHQKIDLISVNLREPQGDGIPF